MKQLDQLVLGWIARNNAKYQMCKRCPNDCGYIKLLHSILGAIKGNKRLKNEIIKRIKKNENLRRIVNEAQVNSCFTILEKYGTYFIKGINTKPKSLRIIQLCANTMLNLHEITKADDEQLKRLVTKRTERMLVDFAKIKGMNIDFDFLDDKDKNLGEGYTPFSTESPKFDAKGTIFHPVNVEWMDEKEEKEKNQ